jgi:hypothetical protein
MPPGSSLRGHDIHDGASRSRQLSAVPINSFAAQPAADYGPILISRAATLADLLP